MSTSSLSLFTLALASTVLAAPTTKSILKTRQTTPQFSITALSQNLPVGPPYGTGAIATTLSLTVSYPDPAGSDATLSTVCSYTWPVGVLNGTDWTDCQDASLQWRLPAAEYVGGTDFLVELFETVAAADG